MEFLKNPEVGDCVRVFPGMQAFSVYTCNKDHTGYSCYSKEHNKFVLQDNVIYKIASVRVRYGKVDSLYLTGFGLPPFIETDLEALFNVEDFVKA